MNYLISEVPYFQTPNDIFETDLDIYSKSAYMYLCRCSNNGKAAFPSYQTIADKCSMSRRKAIDSVKKLLEREFIVKQYRIKDDGENYSNIYKVNYDIGSAQYALGGVLDALCSAQDAPNKELPKKNYIEINNLLHHTTYDGYVLIDILEEFCFYKFNKHIRKHNGDYVFEHLTDISKDEFLEFLEENINKYDNCNLDYLMSIEARIM